MTWANFKGAARRIDDIDLPKIGHQIGVGEDEIHAVMDVEAAGSGFDSKGRPRILFERHHFYRQLRGSERQEATRKGLAVKSWSRATYGKDQYSLLKQAMKINETAALKACSWGLGQIMGWNYKVAGYESVQDMVKAFMEDEEDHLQAMINFIKNSNLDDELRRHDWAGFARGYNGAGYRKNRYDDKLAASYRKWSRIKNTPWNPAMVEVAKDANKKGLKSSTNKAAGISAITTSIVAAKPVIDAVNDAKDGVSSIVSAGPWVLLAMVGIGAGFYIYRERSRKAQLAEEALNA